MISGVAEMKSRLGSAIKYIALVVVIGALIWFYQTFMIPETREVYIPTPPVEVTKPRLGTLTEQIVLAGYAEAEKLVTVLPQVGGQIGSLYVQEGQRVFSGDLLAVIDRRSMQLQVDQAEAAYRSAESSFNRVKNLYESGAATQQNYDQAKAQYENYRTQYELARLQLEYSNITAPIAGTVLTTHTTEGSQVGPQVPIATIADLSRQQIRVHVPEVYYDLFTQRRDEIRVTIQRPGASGTASTGRVLRVNAYIDAESRSFEAVCSIDRPGDLRPGMYVEVTCLIEEYDDLYILPYQVLVTGNHLWYVDPETGRAHRLQIDPGIETDEGFSIPATYRSYLFIREGQHFLREGQSVHMINYQREG
jgi:RND family efflux transporter MFP subunit